MYKWPDKDKDEIIDYSVDWSRLLGSDSISSVDWYIIDTDGTKTNVVDADIVNELQFVTGTLTNTVATARLSLGKNNVRYTIVCRIATVGGLQYERSIFVRIKEK